MASYPARKLINKIMLSLITVSAIFLFVPLLFIFFYLLKNGISSLDLNFFAELPKPVGEQGGGMLHALLGTLYMVLLCAIFAIPWGIAGGVYLSEYKQDRFAKILRFATDLLNGTPSIVFGIFVYAILVKPFKSFSALAGAIALTFVTLPIIIRSVEEVLKLVPQTLRHAGLGLGLPRWKVILWIVVWGSRKNLMTGILLALARAAGETAPLLFTAFGNTYLSFSPTEPMASLPVEIYNYAISPYKQWHDLAWTGALVLILLVFSLNITAKLIVNYDRIKKIKGKS